MKPFLLLFLICLSVSCSSTKDSSSTSNSGDLDGDWYPIQQEINGQPLELASFENQKLIIIGSSFIFMAESVDEGNVTYNNGKMDIYVDTGVNAGRLFKAIYKLENDLLILCYDLKGGSYPESFDTSKNPNFFLSTFRKE